MPVLYIIAGGNGSGKTTFAKKYAKLKSIDFINADEIAAILNPNNPNAMLVSSGKIFLKEVNSKVQAKETFALETTLSGKYIEKIIKKAKQKKYKIELVYLFLNSAENNIKRIKNRVKKGGHHVPSRDVRRRIVRSKKLFWEVIRNQADYWSLYFNASATPILVACGDKNDTIIENEKLFNKFKTGVNK